MWRTTISIFIALLLIPGMLSAQEQPRKRKPNTSIEEILIDYGRTKQRAEEAVLQQARNKAFDGDYELKYINLGNKDEEQYCIIKIKHDVYRPSNRKPLEEATVGYGRTIAMAEIDARYKAERMINERLNSAKERAARAALMEEAAKKRESAAIGEAVILDKDDDTSYILKGIRFTGQTDDYVCYINFEYLVLK
ncbi:hypothetical protein [Cerasicoccus frondis]|uniref:hypothetical protein n=1 Tax=Cerasicoccus frondis TaxID=490090 RepID=UPI0028528E34|nr:hypothetical protein [Cerasicoccus frondis]